MSADLDSLVGSGTAAESSSLTNALNALTSQSFELRLANRTTTNVPANPGVSYVAAVSLIQAITNTSRQNSEKHWANVKRESELATRGCKFPGRGQGKTDVIDLTTSMQVIMALPGKTAARFRLKASVLLVRFLSGDLNLIAEVYGMNKLQAYLQEADPTHPLARVAQTAVAQGLVAPASSKHETEARVRAIEAESALHLQHMSRLNKLEFEAKSRDVALEFEAKSRDVALEGDAKRARVDNQKAIDAERRDAACAAARLDTLQKNAAERDFISQRTRELEADVASGALTREQLREELCLLTPKRNDGTTVRDFIVNYLRGDGRLAPAVEREARRSVLSKEYCKPVTHFDKLDRVMWFIGPDGEFLKSLYNTESDKRAGIPGGQQRLGLA